MKNTKKKILRYIGIALIVIGACVLAYPAYTNFVMKKQESKILAAWNDQVSSFTTSEKQSAETTQTQESGIDSVIGSDSELETASSAEEVTSETASSYVPPEELFILDPNKKIPFKILIPKIKVEWIVHEGTDIQSLKRGPGHYPGTALPGENGMCVIAGHRTTYGAPFNKVDLLVAGDEIILQTADGTNYIYNVTDVIAVKADDVSLLKPTNYPALALTTCHPKFHATQRLIVFANLKQ